MCIYHHLSMLCTLLLLSYFYHWQTKKMTDPTLIDGMHAFATKFYLSSVSLKGWWFQQMFYHPHVIKKTWYLDLSSVHRDIVSHMLLCANRYYELKPDDPPYAAKFYDCCGAEDPVIPGCCTSFHISYDDPWKLINKKVF